MLLGRTGVGKSSLGNQLFGDKMTFAVGHKSTSKTERISWASDHYLGTGQCITIIDTPGTKDTEGEEILRLEHSFRICYYFFFRKRLSTFTGDAKDSQEQNKID